MSYDRSDSIKRSLRYCGRSFTGEEIAQIRRLIATKGEANRAELSRLVSEALGWRRPDGRPKEMSCRVAMLRMERDGLIALPAPQRRNGNGQARARLTSASDPREPISLPARELGKLLFRLVDKREDSSLWNELIERYHYLGYKPLVGAQLRYLVFSGSASARRATARRDLLAALGFGAAAWALAPRDQFIGWTTQQRESNLHLIVNNARFLIVPWVTSQNLASRILAGVAKQLCDDWKSRYSYQPVLTETFVEKNRFQGTCYRAANWIHVGQTQGRGKLDRHNRRGFLLVEHTARRGFL